MSQKFGDFVVKFHMILRLLSKYQIKWKITPSFCGLLRKTELYHCGLLISECMKFNDRKEGVDDSKDYFEN